MPPTLSSLLQPRLPQFYRDAGCPRCTASGIAPSWARAVVPLCTALRGQLVGDHHQPPGAEHGPGRGGRAVGSGRVRHLAVRGAVATGLTYAIRPLVGLRGRSHHRQHLHQRRLRTADALRAPGRRSGRVCRHRAIELAARPGGGHRGPRWLPARWRCWRSCCGAKGSPPLVTFPAIDATPSPRDHRNLDELEADLALPRSHVPVGKQVLADDARGVLPQTFARDPSRVSVGLMRTATPKSEKSSACPGSSQNVPVPNPIAQTPPTMRQ